MMRVMVSVLQHGDANFVSAAGGVSTGFGVVYELSNHLAVDLHGEHTAKVDEVNGWGARLAVLLACAEDGDGGVQVADVGVVRVGGHVELQ